MKTTNSLKRDWTIGSGKNAWSNGFITDWQPANPGSKYPTIGSALYCKTRKDGSVAWSERRAYAESFARRDGLLK
jgi:hypothetical protein